MVLNSFDDLVRFTFGAGLTVLVLDSIWFSQSCNPYISRLYKDVVCNLNGCKTPLSGGTIVRGQAAAAAYTILILGLSWFIYTASRQTSAGQITKKSLLLQAAVFALVVYGVYNATNTAIFSKYPMFLAIIDTLWGMIVCTTATWIGLSIS